jgi:hypothetical protein
MISKGIMVIQNSINCPEGCYYVWSHIYSLNWEHLHISCNAELLTDCSCTCQGMRKQRKHKTSSASCSNFCVSPHMKQRLVYLHNMSMGFNVFKDHVSAFLLNLLHPSKSEPKHKRLGKWWNRAQEKNFPHFATSQIQGQRWSSTVRTW